MKNSEFIEKIKKTQELLEATDKQLAKHMRLEHKYFMKLKNGERTLTVVKRRRLVKRLERLLELCGLN